MNNQNSITIIIYIFTEDSSDFSVDGLALTLSSCSAVCFTNVSTLSASTDSLIELTETLEISIDTSILDTFTGLTLPSVVTFEIDDANGNNNLKGNFF